MAKEVSGKPFVMGPNPIGLQEMSLMFPPHEDKGVMKDN
jgi:hypothetical protein